MKTFIFAAKDTLFVCAEETQGQMRQIASRELTPELHGFISLDQITAKAALAAIEVEAALKKQNPYV